MLAADRLLVLVLCCMVAVHPACSYPDYFVQQYSNGVCTAHPQRAYGNHGVPTADRVTTVQFAPLAALPTFGKLCPGALYTIKVQFPQPRLALLTSSTGSFDGAGNTCPNRIVTPGKNPVTIWEPTLQIPCTAAGQSLQLKVTSAISSLGAYMTATATLPVSNQAGQCQQVSASACKGKERQLRASDATNVAASVFNPISPDGAVVAVDGPSPELTAAPLAAPVYSFRPIIPGNKLLWQFLHSLLMILAFGLLLPLGILLARHKWIFGRDPATGKVSSSWFYLHLLVQILGSLSAIAGVVIAILAFGWKDVPGMTLYVPHKWLGVGVIAMTLLQLLIAPLRPAHSSRSRTSWNFWHHSWGRLTVLAGTSNTIVGALLVHDLQGAPYLHWFLPACVVIGVMLLLALTLEAFKMQMQRTYRYNSHTGVMLPVMQGHKHSKRRPGAGYLPNTTAGIRSSNGLHPAGPADAVNGYDESAYPEVRFDALDTARRLDQDRRSQRGVMITNGQR